jgi:hypothetical protein
VSKRDALRASDADRDHVIDRLHGAATEGRIAAEELEQRVTTALRARTYGELESTTADLPGPGRPRSRTGGPARSLGRWAYSAIRANPTLGLLLLPLIILALAIVFAAIVIWAVLVTVVLLVGRRPMAVGWGDRNRQRLHASRRGPGSSWV